MNAKRFRIAFSFAGERRDFVRKVADLLVQRFGEPAILYDKFHEAELATADLAFDLPALYKNEADLIVAVFSADYEHKEWCGLEWRAIFSMIKEGGAKKILLTRFDHTDGKGLFGLGGFIELDHKTPEQAAALILERLALNEGLPKGHYHYTKPATPPASVLKTDIPHNLPTLQPFFGREDELRKIAEALDPNSHTWGAVINGPGGMGKTSLAVRAAYDASPDDFKRIIFISLKTRELDDDGVRDLSGFLISGLLELYNELARELGRPDIAKSPEDQRARLLLEALRDSRALLVLDNLESLLKTERDQIFTFVKRLPPGCKAILTSRRRIGSSAEELILERLGQQAALAALAELATHNPRLGATSADERIELYEQTAGKPLLLRWTAGQVGRGHCLTLADALAFLRSCPPNNDPLKFIFGDLIEEFTPEETHVLSALSCFGVPAKVEQIAEVAGLPVEATAHALRSLTNRALAVPDAELSAFNTVPLVSDFLPKARPGIVSEVRTRLEHRALELLSEHGGEKHDRFSALDAAWPIIAATLPRILAGPNAQLQTVCEALKTFLEYRGRWDEWLALSRGAEKVAVSAGDFLHAGDRARDAAWVHHERKQSAAMLSWIERAGKHWRAANFGPRGEATVLRFRGFAHEMAREYSAAIECATRALELYEGVEPQGVGIANIFADRACHKMRSGDLEGAEDDYLQALRLCKLHGYDEGVACYTGNLATLALNRDDWLLAEAYSRASLALSEKVGRVTLIIADCNRLASVLVELHRHEEALPFAQKAFDLGQKIDSTYLAMSRRLLKVCEERL